MMNICLMWKRMRFYKLVRKLRKFPNQLKLCINISMIQIRLISCWINIFDFRQFNFILSSFDFLNKTLEFLALFLLRHNFEF